MINEESAIKKKKKRKNSTEARRQGRQTKQRAWFWWYKASGGGIQSRHKFALKSLHTVAVHCVCETSVCLSTLVRPCLPLFHRIAPFHSVKQSKRWLAGCCWLLIGKGLLHINLTKCKLGCQLKLGTWMEEGGSLLFSALLCFHFLILLQTGGSSAVLCATKTKITSNSWSRSVRTRKNEKYAQQSYWFISSA